jgi:hypothetical protein
VRDASKLLVIATAAIGLSLLLIAVPRDAAHALGYLLPSVVSFPCAALARRRALQRAMRTGASVTGGAESQFRWVVVLGLLVCLAQTALLALAWSR